MELKKVRPRVVQYVCAYGKVSTVTESQCASTGVWDSATVGGNVACSSLLTQLTVAAGSMRTNTESTALPWCSKSLMISLQLLTCLPCALASLLASTTCLCSSSFRSKPGTVVKPGMMNGLPIASLSHVQTYDQFDRSAWPTVKNEKHFLMVPRRGGGRKHLEKWWVWLVWTEKGWATDDQLTNSHPCLSALWGAFEIKLQMQKAERSFLGWVAGPTLWSFHIQG